MEEENKEEKQNESDEIRNYGSTTAGRLGEHIHVMTVIGQIEGHYALGEGQKTTKYEHLIPELVAVDESDEVDGLLIILNTMGGDVEAGLALSEMIAGMRKPTASIVLGGGHSIGVPLAVSAKRSFIVPSATMTVHPVRLTGMVIGVPQTYNYLERMQDRIIRFIVSHSGVSEETFRAMLMRTDQIATDVGSVIDGNEAVACGLIDAVGSLSDAVQYLKNEMKKAGNV